METHSRDKFLTDAIGEYWHYPMVEFMDDGVSPTCACGSNYDFCRLCGLIPFSSWQGYAKLWGWAKTQKWWADFLSSNMDTADLFKNLIQPDRFADAIYNKLTGESIKIHSSLTPIKSVDNNKLNYNNIMLKFYHY